MDYRFPFDTLYELVEQGSDAAIDFMVPELDSLMGTASWSDLDGFLNELALDRLDCDTSVAVLAYLAPVKVQLSLWQVWTQMLRLRLSAELDQGTIDDAMLYYE
jgi:hypothetical protein